MKINITHKNLLDIINLHYKCFYPLHNFVGKKEFLSIINSFQFNKKVFFPFPIYLSISQKKYKLIKNENIVEAYYLSKKVCELKVKSFFKLNKKKIGEKLFKTKNKNHPGFKDFLNSGEYFVNCSIKKFNKKVMKNLNFSRPVDVKSYFFKKKIKTIVGFHTRNVPHKAHEWIHSYGLKKCKNLLIHPLIGQFKKGEYKEDAVIKSNYKIIKDIYKNKKIHFALFNSYPRYAGPREAMLHALVRRNYGCTHFLVGRDHAGIGNFYEKYDSQKKCLKFQKKLKIKIIPFDEPYLCKSCKVIVNKKCNLCKSIKKQPLSGTLIRRKILKGQKIPNYLMDKRISKKLSKSSII